MPDGPNYLVRCRFSTSTGGRIGAGTSLVLVAVVLVFGARSSARPMGGKPGPVQPIADPKLRTDRYGDPLPSGALARIGTERWRHGGDVCALAFSPDGQRLASGAFDGSIMLWDRSTGRRLRQFTSEFGHTSLAFSDDGRYLLSVIANGSATRVWDTETGQNLGPPLSRGPATSQTVKHTAITYHADGKTAIAAHWRHKTVLVTEMATGREIQRFVGHQAEIVHTAFSPDRQTLISADQDNRVRLWQVATGRELRTITIRGRYQGFQVSQGDVSFALSPNGRMLASGFDESLRLWEVETGQERRRLGGNGIGRVTALAFAPDGRTLASGGSDNSIRLWDVATGRETNTPPVAHASFATAIVSPDGKTLATANVDNTVRLCEVASGRELWAVKGTGRQQRIAGQRDPDTGVTIPQFVEYPWVRCLAFAPDGQTLAGGGPGSATIYLWEAATGREVRRLTGHTDEIASVAFSADGQTLVSGSKDRTIRLWDVGTGRDVRQIDGRQGQILAAVLSPNGQLLASMGFEDGFPPPQPPGFWLGGGGRMCNTIRFWDVATGTDVRHLSAPLQALVRKRDGIITLGQPEGPPPLTHTVTVSPDGRTVTSLGFDDFIRLWDVATGKELRRWSRDPDWTPDRPEPLGGTTASGAIERLAFSPGGKLLAVEWRKTVNLYDVASGQLRGQLVGHAGAIRSLSFAADGKTLATGSADDTTLIWDMAAIPPPDRR